MCHAEQVIEVIVKRLRCSFQVAWIDLKRGRASAAFGALFDAHFLASAKQANYARSFFEDSISDCLSIHSEN